NLSNSPDAPGGNLCARTSLCRESFRLPLGRRAHASLHAMSSGSLAIVRQARFRSAIVRLPDIVLQSQSSSKSLQRRDRKAFWSPPTCTHRLVLENLI